MSASKTAASVAKQAKRATRFEKYTVQPVGIWGRINRWFAVDPNRSTGIPLNPQFRNPPPGAVDPNLYDDPVTIPAADLADNPYWKRDMRRRYPQLSAVTQADVVGLLTVGSEAQPKQELIGDGGQKQLVAVKEEGEKGLAAFFEKEKGVNENVLGPGGLPPLPKGLNVTKDGKKDYSLLREQSYTDNYPCRSFQ